MLEEHIKQMSEFQHTAACRRLGTSRAIFAFLAFVSTHSRLKAAGNLCRKGIKNEQLFQHTAA